MKNGKHCFIDGKRLCTLKCRAAYRNKKDIECTFVWLATQVGWVNFEGGMKIYKKWNAKKRN
jgi:hypothetical protein